MRKETIGACELYLGDCLEVLPDIGVMDVVITDPPYNCGKKYEIHRDDMAPDQYITWLSSVWSTCKSETIVYTPGDRHIWDSPRICEAAGFKMGRPLAWHRKEFAGDKWSGGPAMSWEPVIWAYRGDKKFNRIFGHAGRDHLTVNCVRFTPFRDQHPCPKPIEVMRWLVGIFASGSVLDPFMGTGTVGIACLEAGLPFIGIESGPEAFDIACRRIEAATKQPDLFIEQPKPAEQLSMLEAAE